VLITLALDIMRLCAVFDIVSFMSPCVGLLNYVLIFFQYLIKLFLYINSCTPTKKNYKLCLYINPLSCFINTLSIVSHYLYCHIIYRVTLSIVSHYIQCHIIYIVTLSIVSHYLYCHLIYSVTLSIASRYLYCHIIYSITLSIVSHYL
jgi:hypothetical protein